MNRSVTESESQNSTEELAEQPAASVQPVSPPGPQILVRYGAIPVVARCVVGPEVESEVSPGNWRRGTRLVISTSRGTEVAEFMQALKPSESKSDVSISLVRVATSDDAQKANELKAKTAQEFETWNQRIHDWKLQLELIDLERTFDGEKLILYVLNDRGPDTTKLAIQATASGFGVIEVQSVDANGMVEAPSGGGGGCGSGGCGCH